MVKKIVELTKYEEARIVGARALQLSMGAPPLVKVPEGVINPVILAQMEFEKHVIPLVVYHEAAA